MESRMVPLPGTVIVINIGMGSIKLMVHRIGGLSWRIERSSEEHVDPQVVKKLEGLGGQVTMIDKNQ